MRLLSWVWVGVMVLIGNRIGYGIPVMDALPGVLIIIAAVLMGDLIYVGTRRKLPAVCWISFIAMAAAFPHTPFAAGTAMTAKVSFLAMITAHADLCGSVAGRTFLPSAAWAGALSSSRCWPMPACFWRPP